MDAQACFQSMYGDLQRQLNSDDISGYLFSAGVLTMIDLGKINNIMFNNHMKVTELLDAVARAINRDTSNFSKFLDSLDKVLSYRAIASRARGEWLSVMCSKDVRELLILNILLLMS